MSEKKKILLLSDHPLVPSGVGTQARYLIEGLLATGKYKFVCFGGAIKHPDYRPQKVLPEKYGDDGWIIHPVDGYGDKDKIRAILRAERPDAMLLFTDPRFFVWVWEIEDEIRKFCPILYWHVWDNDPAPRFNKVFYESTDFVSALSLKTFGLLQDLELNNYNYIPHAVSPDIFKPLSEDESRRFRKEHMGPHADKKFIAFWNNRNARRKMTGDVIATFSKFADRVGKENVALAMHTMVADPEGQNIIEVARCFGIESNMIVSEDRVSPEILNGFYNACDCTINIANNEGFGLSTLESIMSGTPIIAHMTGGLQFQMGDWWEGLKNFRSQDELTARAKNMWKKQTSLWTGVPVFPASRSCTGSQQIPYIYDDRVSHESVVDAFSHLYRMGRERRKELGVKASEWARKKFSLTSMIDSWDNTFQEQIRKFCESSSTRNRVVSL